MVFFNYALRKLNAKIVYYGPGLCGKTTNLVWIHDHFEGGERGKMISLATEGDRTIFFDLLPLEIGSIRGMDVTLQLYTVPGQVHYNSTRQLVLRGADGVVFVADSQRALQSSNIESFRNLQENLLLQGISLEGFPLAIQFNKRDLKDTLPVEELDSDLNIFRVPIFEAVATEGVGVQETLEGIVKLVMRSLRVRYEGAGHDVQPGAADPAATMQVPSAATPPGVVAPGPTPVPAPTPAGAPPPATPPPSVIKTPSATPEPPPMEPPPAPAAPKPPPVEPIQPPAVSEPPPVAGPPDEIVFPEDPGPAAPTPPETTEPAPASKPTGGGFEDEVSTAVYEVGDEVEVGPDDFSEAPMDGDVFSSSDDGGFLDEVTKTETVAPPEPAAPPEPVVPPELFTPPEPDFPPDPIPPTVAEPPFEPAVPAVPDVPPVTETPVASTETPIFEEPEVVGPEASEIPMAAEDIAAMDEPVIEFVTDDGGGDAPPPTADQPAPSEQYLDRIVAPSPFAPQGEAAVGAGEGAEVGPTDELMRALEGEAAVASAAALEEEIVVDESSDGAIEAPVDETPADDLAAASEPLIVGDGDPFAEPEPVIEPEDISAPEPEPVLEPEPEPVEVVPEPIEPAAIETAEPREVAVRAEDNQLHLRLQGTGAIVESGQVRALDIEVPVPGSWVGNKRVTLQLRLTLTPDSEEENDESGDTS